MSKCEYHIILITSIDNMIITDRTTWFTYILHTTFMSTFNIISKWEECITT